MSSNLDQLGFETLFNAALERGQREIRLLQGNIKESEEKQVAAQDDMTKARQQLVPTQKVGPRKQAKISKIAIAAIDAAQAKYATAYKEEKAAREKLRLMTYKIQLCQLSIDDSEEE